MKNYTHTKNNTMIDFGVLTKLALVITFIISLSVLSHAEDIYECDITHSGEQCIIYMEDHFREDAELKDVLALCEYWDGEYRPDGDICVIHTNSYERR